jgi:uncharacterized membrane protein YbhN (UPF0104 family)
MRWRWGRTVESLLAVGLFVAILAVFVGPERLLADLRAVDGRVYALAFGLALVWLFAWSQTLLRLLEAEAGNLDDAYFYVVYVAGTFARGLVPGGSVSGPGVMAYVVNAYTDVEPERTLAMTTVSELCYMLASATAAVVGFGLLAATGDVPRAAFLPLIAATMVGVGGVALLGVGALRPDLVRRLLRWPLIRLGRLLGRVWERAGEALAPAAVDERIDNAFGAVGALRETPRAALSALGYAHLGIACSAGTLYVSTVAMGLDVSPLVALFVVPVGGLARGLSFLPGGLGSVEAGMIGLFTVVTPLSAGVAGTAVLLHRLTTFWFRLLVGAACLLFLGLTRSPLRTVPDPTAG